MNSVDKAALMQRANDAIEQLRPFLIADGGDLELVNISDDLVAQVELKGTCKDCSMNKMTFTNGIVDAIKRAVPELTGVEGINFTLSE